MRKFLASIIITCALTTIGCKNITKTDSDELQIKEHVQHWIDISEKGDTDRYLEFVTDDFIFYGPGSQPIENLDSLQAFLEPFFKNNTFSMPNWESHEIIVKEDIAIHRWSGIGYIESKQEKTKYTFDRKYLDVYKKDIHGEWKCYLHSFNSNN